jgi:uncharacterized protein (TIGR02099 family)
MPQVPTAAHLPMPSSQPSWGLRWVSRAIALVWWLCLAATVVFALSWVALHAVIVPRIDQLRPRLEKQLGQTLGATVRIGSIRAESQTLAPSFELRDVRLQDSTGRDALILGKVTATLSPRSLMHLGLEQLVIDQPELDIRRNAQGRTSIAGFELPDASPEQGKDSSPAADWLFSQRELVIRSGTVLWTDELRGAAPLPLRDVDVVLRNSSQEHRLRIDATPPAEWGNRFNAIAQFTSPLWSSHAGQWREWEGELFADFSRIDLAQLHHYADTGVDIARGVGALRSWASLNEGQLTEGTADLALSEMDVRLGKDVASLAVQAVQSRMAVQVVDEGLRLTTEGLSFRTTDGVQWPGGNIAFLQTGHRQGHAGRGELSADKLDLAVLAQVIDTLPIGTATHALVRSLNPKGNVDSVQATWQGHISAPTAYTAQARASKLEFASQAPSRPGVRGATVDVKLNQAGGQAKLVIQQGALDLPGAFDDPVIKLDTLETDAQWTIDGDKISLQLEKLRFSNADAQGELQAQWQTADPAKSSAKSRFPGVLDLQGTLTRGDGTQVFRYLPKTIDAFARDYVRNAVQKGRITAAQFKLKGDLFDMPFSDPKRGEFRIAAQIADAQFAFVPESIREKDSLPWPALTQLQGELVFDRTAMNLNAATGRIGQNNSLQITRGEARIPDLDAPTTTVLVNADTRGSLVDMLALVNSSPLSAITSQALAKTKATGAADLKFRLNLPLDRIDRSKVSGTLTLAGNDVQITPDSPLLGNAKGVVAFNENGFALNSVQARMLGGDIRIDGGSRPGAGENDASPIFKAQGTISAENLRQAKELGFASRIAQNAAGSAAYAATLGFRRGAPELTISSNLQGMSLNLPPPLAKPAESTLALRYENSSVGTATVAGKAQQDQVLLDLGSIASIMYVRDVSGAEPRVLRGSIAVGLAPGESAPATEDGVVANINFAQIDIDAWEKVLRNAAGTPSSNSDSTTTVFTNTAAAGATTSAFGYLPSVMAVRARELTVQGRTLHNIVVGGSRDGLTWRANLDARELNGYLEFRQGSGNNPGRVYARLARLNIAQSEAARLEQALEAPPTAIPALDIVVEDLDLLGKKLGRAEVEATNRGIGFASQGNSAREWRLTKLNIAMPEAQFSATGNWAAVGANGLNLPRTANNNERLRTVLNFKLDIADSGELLKRFGMDKVIAKGKGNMEGQVAWLGSPFSLDYPTLGGSFNVDIESGRFLKADPGIAKLLGVLSLQTLPRRLTLDFRDVFSEGFSFDFIRGNVKIDQGVAFTNNLQMKGVNAAVLMEGNANIAKETQDMRVVVVPEINAGTASLVAAVINPAIGLGTFLAQLILRKPVIEAATQEFHIDGAWADPKITKVARKSKAVGAAAPDTPAVPPALTN